MPASADNGAREAEDTPTTLLNLPWELIVQALGKADLFSLCSAVCTCHEMQSLVGASLGVAGRPHLSVRHLLAAGAQHSAFACPSRGCIFTCGTDEHCRGYLGHGQPVESHDAPTHFLPTPIRSTLPRPTVERFIAVATHSLHTLALTTAGAVYSFGHGDKGKLGHGDSEPRWHPTRINALAGVRVVAIAAGEQHNLVLDEHGVVHTFGSGFSGKLGHGDQHSRSVPCAIGTLHAVASVDAGACHSLLVTRDGALFTFGAGSMGQLGHGRQCDELTPRKVQSFEAGAICVANAAGGTFHSLAVDRDGRCYSWGAGEARERTSTWPGGWLGHRSLDTELVPRCIHALDTVRVLNVVASSYHSMALATGGAVFTWGDGDGGKLGHDDGGRMHWVPRRVASMDGQRAVAICAGESHSLCLLDDGRILGWGAGHAIGLTHEAMTRQDMTPSSWGSAGNYEWAPGDMLRSWQAHSPSEVRLV